MLFCCHPGDESESGQDKQSFLEKIFKFSTDKGKPRDAARVLAAAQHLRSSARKKLVELGHQIQGRVMLAPIDEDHLLGGSPESDAYHKCRERPFYFNDCNYPSAIVLVKTSEDVAKTVKLAASLLEENAKYKLCLASGCHSAYCMVEHSIVLDMQKLDKVTFNQKEKTVTVQGGAKIRAVHKALKDTGWSIMTGTNEDTGVTGLTLSGGAGFLGGKAGYACDTVLSAKVVLGSGNIVTATDENEYKDLLRALRGGGGNFGVVIEWTFQLFDVSNVIAGMVGHLVPTTASVKQIWDEYFEAVKDSPDEAWSSAAAPAGLPLFATVLTVIGPKVKDAKSYKDIPFLSKLVELNSWIRVLNTVGHKDYFKDVATMLEGAQQRTYGFVLGTMVYSLDEALRDTIIHFTRVDVPGRNSKAVIAMQSLSGEMRRIPASKSSLRHRKAVAWVIVEASWQPQATEEQIQSITDWAFRVKKRLMEIGGEDGPHNFCDTDGRRIKFLNDEQRAFLVEAKKKYDPQNLFSLNKNIISKYV